MTLSIGVRVVQRRLRMYGRKIDVPEATQCGQSWEISSCVTFLERGNIMKNPMCCLIAVPPAAEGLRI
jgi:hypothetical protein